MTDPNTPPAASERMTDAETLDEEAMDANDKLSKLAALVIDMKVGTPYGHKVKAYARHCLNSGPDPLREVLPHEQEGSESHAAALSPQPDRAKAGWGCRVRGSSVPYPQECDWPHCDCDPSTAKVLEALSEEGYLSPNEARTLTARAEAAERELATERTLREAAEWAAKNTKGERVIELEQRAEAAEARAESVREALTKFWKLSLVFESAVRRADGPSNHAETLAAIRFTQELIKSGEFVFPAKNSEENEGLCDDCPRVGHSTDKTRCLPCPRRTALLTAPPPTAKEDK